MRKELAARPNCSSPRVACAGSSVPISSGVVCVQGDCEEKNWVQRGQEDSVMTWMEGAIFSEKGALERRQRFRLVLSHTQMVVSNRAM